MTQDLVLIKEVNQSRDTILGVYTFYSVYAIEHISRTGIHAVAKGTALQGGVHIAGILYDVTAGADLLHTLSKRKKPSIYQILLNILKTWLNFAFLTS